MHEVTEIRVLFTCLVDAILLINVFKLLSLHILTIYIFYKSVEFLDFAPSKAAQQNNIICTNFFFEPTVWKKPIQEISVLGKIHVRLKKWIFYNFYH